LWSDTEHQGLAPHATVEIKQTDLTHLCLQLYAFGCSDPSEMQWMDQPPAGPWQKAEQLLVELGALHLHKSLEAVKQLAPLTKGFVITPHGQRINQLPLSPRLGHLLVTAQRYNALLLGCQLVALLSEKDPLATNSDKNYDLMLRVNWLNSNRPTPSNLVGLRQRITKQAKRLLSQMPPDSAPPISHNYNDSQLAAILVAHAWPERIAQQTSDPKQYKLANGKRVTCQQSNAGAQWLAVASSIGFENKTGDNTQRICLAVDLPSSLFFSSLFIHGLASSNSIIQKMK
jgi:ATP-dependent helicase HrpB